MVKDPRTFWEESRTQCSIVSFLRHALPPNYRVVSVPNGRFKADPATIVRLKREGLSPGFLDLMVVKNDGWFCTLEVKSDKGKLSSDQIEWTDWFASGGASTAVVRSLPEAVAALEAFGVPLRARVAA